MYMYACVYLFCYTSARIMKPRQGFSTSVVFITTYDTFPKYGGHVTVARAHHVYRPVFESYLTSAFGKHGRDW